MIVFTPQGVYLFGSDLKGTKLKLCFAYGLQDVHVVVLSTNKYASLQHP